MSSMIREWYVVFDDIPSATMTALRSGIAVDRVNETGSRSDSRGVVEFVRLSLREQLASAQFIPPSLLPRVSPFASSASTISIPSRLVPHRFPKKGVTAVVLLWTNSMAIFFSIVVSSHSVSISMLKLAVSLSDRSKSIQLKLERLCINGFF